MKKAIVRQDHQEQLPEILSSKPLVQSISYIDHIDH